jgi:UDPglucose 6-dehydrogenase
MIISQIGNGFVGSALNKSFLKNGLNINIYDKYQNIGSIDSIINSSIIFFCLPTPYKDGEGYDLMAIEENLSNLSNRSFDGLVIIKSTVLPGTCEYLEKKYKIKIIHNPEFLTERTALEDFNNQKHIVLGFNNRVHNDIIYLYKKYYPNAEISICSSYESESMKIFCNTFYAVKIQIFNEFYYLCQKLNINFEITKNLMLKNGWINPMHTNVPGPDGILSYGGHCFPKDTSALLQQMKKLNTPCAVLDSCILERNNIRKNNE